MTIAMSTPPGQIGVLTAIGGKVVYDIHQGTKEEPKIAITSKQANNIRKIAPEFYKNVENSFIIGKKSDVSDSALIGAAEDYYRNEKTPDEKLGDISGFLIGATTGQDITTKALNRPSLYILEQPKPSLISNTTPVNQKQLLLGNNTNPMLPVGYKTPNLTAPMNKIATEELVKFKNELLVAGAKVDEVTGVVTGPKGGKGHIVGKAPDNTIIVNMSGKNVKFANGKQTSVPVASFTKFELPKTTEIIELPDEVIAQKNYSENGLTGLLDRAKSKIRKKPITQVQLERIGTDVTVRNSGIKIDGTIGAGDKVDKIKNNLSHNFPVYDYTEMENGKITATSTKARDLTRKTYNSPEYKNGLYNAIKKDVDDILGFKKGKSNKIHISKDDINKKILEISVNEYELTKQQMDNIKRGMEYGKMNGVEVKFIIEK